MRRIPTLSLRLFMVALFLFIIAACVPSDPPENPGTNPTPTATGDCDRQCLLGVLDSYLDALVANDPSRLNVSSNLKYTDNGVAAQLGDGLWKTAAGLDNEKRLDFADPVQKNVATQIVINEAGGGGGCGDSGAVIYQVRLKVEQGVIIEIESMTVRRSGAANGFFNVQNMEPESVFTQAVPAGKRMSREELIDLLDLYVDYLEGKVKGKDVPFDQNCKRYENGVVTANGLAAFNMQSWGFRVTRRYPVIDEETGIVWGMLPFNQSARALVVGEAFKMLDGKIMMIQAVMARMPAKAWD